MSKRPRLGDGASPQASLLPIFPLQTVLFPGGVLPLRIFEARYMDMTTRCLKEDTVFGVNLIAEGSEVGKPARPHAVGVSARITAWDMPQSGLLHVVARGERRFRMRRSELGPNGLVLAEVEWLDEPGLQPVPAAFAGVVALLKAIIEDAGETHFPPPHRFDDAAWVGMRLAEVLPAAMPARQLLLELDDPLGRLEIIHAYLAQHGLES